MRIRTNNTLERLNREIKRRTKVVGTFPDGQSALILVCARLRHVASHEWGSKRYLNMQHLRSMVLSKENINAGKELSRSERIVPPTGGYQANHLPSRPRQVLRSLDGRWPV